MSRTNRVLITVGCLLVALPVLSLVAGAVQDAQVGNSTYYDDGPGGLPAQMLVALVIGGLLVLVGVVQHAVARGREHDRQR